MLAVPGSPCSGRDLRPPPSTSRGTPVEAAGAPHLTISIARAALRPRGLLSGLAGAFAFAFPRGRGAQCAVQCGWARGSRPGGSRPVGCQPPGVSARVSAPRQGDTSLIAEHKPAPRPCGSRNADVRVPPNRAGPARTGKANTRPAPVAPPPPPGSQCRSPCRRTPRRDERGNLAGHVGKGHPGHRRGTARGNVTVASSFHREGRESNPAWSEPLNLCVAAVVV